MEVCNVGCLKCQECALHIVGLAAGGQGRNFPIGYWVRG
jgi:hypothetical protein